MPSLTAEAIQKRLSRRVLVLGALQGAAFAGIAGRLAYLQFLHADKYSMLSQENRIKVKLVAPVRGVVLDRFGKPLAENRVNYRLILERDELRQALTSLEQISSLLALDEKTHARLKEIVRETPRYRSALLLDQLSWDSVVKLEFHSAELANVSLEEGQLRSYPFAESAAHLVGYVGRVSKEEEEAHKPLARLPDFKIGKSGVEQAQEQHLQGKAGSRELEVNARGVAVRELSYQPFEPGKPMQLTIDAELQQYATERLGEESGSVIVLDTHRGDVLCCTSMPAFDPNRFSAGITANYWDSLRNHERKPLLNKALSGMYPPGSTFKMIVALAGLEAGIIDEKTSFYCPGHYRLGNRRFNCWKAGGHGYVNVKHAIAESCDTYFYNVGERIGIDAITAMARRFGFGEPSGLGLAGERGGLLPSDEWKRRTHDTPWVKGDTINASIGQGFLLATPMQLAIMTARLASGKALTPLLDMASSPAMAPLSVDTSHLKLIHTGMRAACNERYGTAYWKRITEEGKEMAGKTGTAQVKRILRRGFDQSKLPWHHRHHALFVGYAPEDNPSFAVSVVVEHGGGGSSAAAPIARDVLKKVQERAAAHPQHYRFKVE